MLKTPILFIIFNRPDTTERVFEEIKKQRPQYLYIAADGPRINKEGEAEKCEQTRKILEKIDWDCEVKTLFRENNHGCKNAVSSAITWFFENVEEGIILEDDCLPSQSFFKYCEEILEKYRHDERIMHISGENPVSKEFGDGSYYFTKTAHIWGWASWRRAWKLYDVEMKSYPEFVKNNKIKEVFDKDYHRKYWLKVFNRVIEGKINTWDYQWMYTLYTNNGFSIIPNKNMISNIGFNTEATHTSECNTNLANRPAFEIDEIIHPSEVKQNNETLDLIMKERFNLYPRTPLFILKRELDRAFKKFNRKKK
jgi:hypothetical protein